MQSRASHSGPPPVQMTICSAPALQGYIYCSISATYIPKPAATNFTQIKALEPVELHLGLNPMKRTDSFEHLGLTWTAGKLCPEVSCKIKAPTGTAYGLMGSGLHGQNGIDPSSSLHLRGHPQLSTITLNCYLAVSGWVGQTENPKEQLTFA